MQWSSAWTTGCVILWLAPTILGLLYPRDSETRNQKSLDGIWNFVKPNETVNVGYTDQWFTRNLKEVAPEVMPMPVPASYNDVTVSAALRDHIGPVWYDRTFFAPLTWNSSETRVWLRFGSVHYHAEVWVNGKSVVNHTIGHLPFEADVTTFLEFGASNRVTVSCDNTLTKVTIPQGEVHTITTENGKELTLSQQFDFFNYAGIHRPVLLYTTPRVYISDITIDTSVKDNTGIVSYEVKIDGELPEEKGYLCHVALLDDSVNVSVITAVDENSCKNSIVVENPKLWWPYLMNPNPAHLYTLEVKLLVNQSNDIEPHVIDVYRQPIGIRTLSWSNTTFLINDVPVYLRGMGRHEDSIIRGKGLDLPLITRDYSLIKWLGANTYRTSHYPYAEEIMDFADREGIMIIDECSSVNTHAYSPELLTNHKQALTELIQRDKNRPSVIVWSIANEPDTNPTEAGDHFGAVATHVRSIDKSRPLSIAIATSANSDKAGKHLDLLSFNRYNAWYSNFGHLDTIISGVISEAKLWNTKYNKPVIMSEYGADTLAGLHELPSIGWSEDYQEQLLSRHFQAFDELRKLGFFIGEFIWNFADFNTPQGYTRAGGNHKGIFTRDRQPKAAAYILRRRNFILANLLDNATLPADLLPYLAEDVKDEL